MLATLLNKSHKNRKILKVNRKGGCLDSSPVAIMASPAVSLGSPAATMASPAVSLGSPVAIMASPETITVGNPISLGTPVNPISLGSRVTQGSRGSLVSRGSLANRLYR